MRSMQRNQQTFYYRLYASASELTYQDDYGNTVSLGEYGPTFGEPVEMSANISTASGAVISEQFGRLEDYDKVIVTTDMDCPIDEYSVLYIDTTPTETDGEWSAWDYEVSRIAKSINGIRIYAKRVEVS